MRAIVNTGVGRLDIKELPKPEPGPGEVLIKTIACGICATDILMIEGRERTGFPTIPGHEWSGVVIGAGDTAGERFLGRRCVASNIRADGGEVGFEHPGGYGEYFITDAANVHQLPIHFPPGEATLIEPLAVCVRAAARMGIGLSGESALKKVLIQGDGPIGLLLVMLLSHAGARDICIIGGRGARLSLARDLGAGRTLNYHALDEKPAVAIPEGSETGFDVVFEASGSAAALDACLDLVNHGAKIGVVGVYGDARAGFTWDQLMHRELELIGCNASEGAWEDTVRLAVTGSLPLGRLISHRLPVERFREGIEMMRARGEDIVKVILDWDE